MIRVVIALALGLAACGDNAAPPDAGPLPACVDVCPGAALCSADGVCACVVDGERTECQR